MKAPLRVLHLEDDPDDSELVQAQLAAEGIACQVTRVESRAEFLAALERGEFDLILTDFSLPAFDGLAALDIAREKCPDIPFIIVSGTIGEEPAIETLKRGATDYVLKHRLSRLAPAVRRAMHEAGERAELRRATEALHASEKRFRALIEHSTDAISLLDAAGTVQYTSPATTRILGYAIDEFVGQSAFELLHPDDALRGAETFTQWLQQLGSSATAQFRFRHKDGSWRWVEATGSNLLAEPGVQSIVVNYRDVTERKQRERELEAIATIATALRAASTRAEMLPVVVNQVLGLLKAGGAALALRDPATGETLIAFGSGAWANWAGLRVPPGQGVSGHVMTTGQPYLNNDARSDLLIVRPGLIGDLRAIACVPLIAQGETIGALWAGRTTDMVSEELRLLAAIGDIAANALQRAQIVETLEQRVAERTRELAEANERLTQLDRLKSKFVSDVSHELRTPVTNLTLYTGLLEGGKPDKRDRYLAVLKEQAARLGHLVESILDLSRLELAGDRIALAPVDLNAAIESVVAAHGPGAEAKRLDLTFVPHAGLPAVRGEFNQLALMISNLVANAINYTPAGEVRVYTRLDAARGEACLQVQDTGIGIDPDDVPHLFERFYRGRRVSQSDIPGSGLGLGIVSEIVDLHAGRIEVESVVGAGSTFRVWLPLA